MSRPSALNDEMSDQFCKYLSIGMNVEDAAVLCGITERTVYNWLERGKNLFESQYSEADETIEFGESDNVYLQFFQSVRKAKLASKAKALTTILDAMPEKPHLSFEWLRREYPKEWGLKDLPQYNQQTLVVNGTEVNKDGTLDLDSIREYVAESERKGELVRGIEPEKLITDVTEHATSATGASDSQ